MGDVMTGDVRSFDASPQAASLIEGLRDLGYSLETALADIIDNSIAAKASRVSIRADFNNGSPVVTITDDGCGMDEETLRNAMRPGSFNPRHLRAAHDLGRFGLGLKTASFSQCRKLTVITRSPSGTYAAQWDLDYVAQMNEWRVLLPNPDDIPHTNLLGDQPSGTVIVWEQCDRLTDSESVAVDSNRFNERIAKAEQHLELVFHRYLEGEAGLNRLSMSVNQRPLIALNPFFPSRSSQRPMDKIPSAQGGYVLVIPYTLPHHNSVTEADWERLSLGEGYVRSQGFYLYRRKRLIVHGTWFGLARQLDLSKLARVRVDLPEHSDDLWKVNVLKASAQPPGAVRQHLSRIVSELTRDSRRAYQHRGKRLDKVAPDLIWERRVAHGSISYAINTAHSVFGPLRTMLDEAALRELQRALGLVARTIPYDSILVDLNESPKDLRSPEIELGDLRALVATYLDALRREGFGKDASIRVLRDTSAFSTDWHLVSAQVDEYWKQVKVDDEPAI
jgi:hypothetical protein